jgi:hypothetical protein
LEEDTETLRMAKAKMIVSGAARGDTSTMPALTDWSMMRKATARHAIVAPTTVKRAA